MTRAIEHVYISKWWQSLPLILRTSCGIYFTWSTQLSSVECTLPKIKIIFPITVSHSFTGARFLWTTLRVDLKQHHCDLALFRLMNLVESFVSAVQSGRHKELGRPGKFQQTLPSDSLKLQTLSQHFWSTCLKRCFYWYDIYLWFLRSFELISQGWLRFNYCNFASRGLGNVLWQDGAIPTMACEDLRMASHRAIIVMSGQKKVPTFSNFPQRFMEMEGYSQNRKIYNSAPRGNLDASFKCSNLHVRVPLFFFSQNLQKGQSCHWLPIHVCLPEKNRPSRPGNKEVAHAATTNQGQVGAWVSCDNHQLAKSKESLQSFLDAWVCIFISFFRSVFCSLGTGDGWGSLWDLGHFISVLTSQWSMLAGHMSKESTVLIPPSSKSMEATPRSRWMHAALDTAEQTCPLVSKVTKCILLS